jgi:hypothetical protein
MKNLTQILIGIIVLLFLKSKRLRLEFTKRMNEIYGLNINENILILECTLLKLKKVNLNKFISANICLQDKII